MFIQPFKFGMFYPTLPTAYGNSLSYYEELEKVACKVNEIIETVNTGLSDIIAENIEKFFNEIMIDAMYEAETETLILKKEIISTGDVHIYNDATNTIEVV